MSLPLEGSKLHASSLYLEIHTLDVSFSEGLEFFNPPALRATPPRRGILPSSHHSKSHLFYELVVKERY